MATENSKEEKLIVITIYYAYVPECDRIIEIYCLNGRFIDSTAQMAPCWKEITVLLHADERERVRPSEAHQNALPLLNQLCHS